MATDVRYESHVQHCFEFTKIIFGDLSEDKSCLMIEIDNASQNSTYTNEITLKGKEILNKLKKETNLDICSIQNYPVQYKIYFTNLANQKCLLILTQLNEITKNENESAQNFQLGIVGKHIVQYAANLAKKGKYKEAEEYLITERAKYQNDPNLNMDLRLMEISLHDQNNSDQNQNSLTKHKDILSIHLNCAFKTSHVNWAFQLNDF